MSIKVTYELRHEYSFCQGWFWVIYMSEDGYTEHSIYDCRSHEEAVAVLKELREEG